jgi:hypothetical protein
MKTISVLGIVLAFSLGAAFGEAKTDYNHHLDFTKNQPTRSETSKPGMTDSAEAGVGAGSAGWA